MAAYTLEYLDIVVRRHIPDLSKTIRDRIKKTIEERLAIDPISYGKPLQYTLKGHRRMRVGDYRVIYRIVPERKLVLIVAIGHRKDIYDG